MVLLQVSKSDTVPVPTVPVQQNPRVYLYLWSTLMGPEGAHTSPLHESTWSEVTSNLHNNSLQIGLLLVPGVLYLSHAAVLHLVGWHMGMAQVGEVQPGPIPVKPIPVQVRVQTHTIYPWVLSNTAGTCKPIQLCYYFRIFS